MPAVHDMNLHAILLLCDIVGFSKVLEHQQVRMVRHLLDGILSHSIMDGRERGVGYHLNSTGDGFLLVLPSNDKYALQADLIDLARSLVSHCERFDGPSLQIRVGLHVGEHAVCCRSEDDDFTFLVGVGLNWVSRISDIAGPSQVAVSELFVDRYRQKVDTPGFDEIFFPPDGQDAIEVGVKHGKTARIRLLLGGALSEDVPPRLSQLEQIDRHITKALSVVGNTVVKTLVDLDPTLSEELLAPRLTLWIRVEDELAPVRQRDLLPVDPEDEEPPPASRTRYRCGGRDSADRPEGPVATAFSTGLQQYAIGLPDRYQSPGAYFKALDETGIPRTKAKRFTRHARAILAVPVCLLDEPAGVLCVDLMHPLDDHGSAVEKIMANIGLHSANLLAAFVLLRQR